MLAICPPSETLMAGPNRHYWHLDSSQIPPPSSPWSPSAFDVVPSTPHLQHPHHHQHTHHQHPQHPPPPQSPFDTYDPSVNGVLAYRPRVEDFSYPGIHHAMTTSPTIMSATPQPAGQEYPDDPSFETNSDGRVEMNQEDVDAIIRNKRKIRDPKACYACHRRKVKCNRELPCDSCVKRDHPELCSYERPTKKRRIAMTTHFPQGDGTDVKDPSLQSGPNVTVPKEQWERVTKELADLKDHLAATQNGDVADDAAKEDAEEPDRMGIHAPSNQMGTMHVGSRSVLAYMMGLSRTKSAQDSALHMLNDNILPKLGLDNDSVTYPFVDLWSTDSSMKDIDGLCSAIPADNLCKEFFYAYRDVACTIYPVVAELDVFERALDYMLANRSKAQQENLQLNPNSPMGVSLPWLALFFAVLASGAQCSNISAKERELTSQVYICCSYQALRMANFLTHPSLETIQALLIITNVLSFNMNPGVAYIFLGLVIRMAFSMGLQLNPTGFSDHEGWLRRRVWWAIAWQDSHFSVSYDRPTSTVLCGADIPYGPDSSEDNRSYAETMFHVIKLTQEIIRDRAFNPNKHMSWSTIQRHRDSIIDIVGNSEPHLRKRSACGTERQRHIERLALELHSSYLISELCRPALRETGGYSLDDISPQSSPRHSPPPPANSSSRRKSSRTHSRTPPADPALPTQLRRDCLRGLEGCIAAYVELTKHCEFAARSWIGIQRAVSAAFLLGTLPEAHQEPRIVTLLKELEACIEKLTVEEAAFDSLRSNANDPSIANNTVDGSPSDLEGSVWARSMTKSLDALRKLNATLPSSGPGKGVLQQNLQQQQQQQHQRQHGGVTGGSNNNGARQKMGVRGMYMDGASMQNATHVRLPQPRAQQGQQRGAYPPPAAVGGGGGAGAGTGVKMEPYSPSMAHGQAGGPSAGLVIPAAGATGGATGFGGTHWN